MDGVLLGTNTLGSSVEWLFNCGYCTDTEKLHKQSVTEVVAKFGKTYHLDLRYRVLGAPELDGAKMVVNELKLPITIEEYISMVRAFESKVMADVDILPGCYYFVNILLQACQTRRIDKAGYVHYIVYNSPPRELCKKIYWKKNILNKFFNFIHYKHNN